MYISKTRFVNWTRCPLYLPIEIEYNPNGYNDIDDEKERRRELLADISENICPSESESEENEVFDVSLSPELETLLPYYNQVEDEALKVAKKYFKGSFIADFQNVHNQKLFEYTYNGNIYRCYVDIYNENDNEINIIEVKATTSTKYLDITFSDGKRGTSPKALFEKKRNIWGLFDESLITNPDEKKNYAEKKNNFCNRYRDEGKYPHDIAFQRFVIENVLSRKGDKRKVNYYLAVLNSSYIYDGATDAAGKRIYNNVNGEEIITFIDMNKISEDYQPLIKDEIRKLETNISNLQPTSSPVPVGEWCAWGKNTQCLFFDHCFKKLRKVPDSNKSNNYLNFRGFKLGDIKNKFDLVNQSIFGMGDVPNNWLEKENHKIQRDCYDNDTEYVDKGKMTFWFNQIEYPIYHLDFESFPCPLPRFKGESPYQQSVFEFSLHIESTPGVCDKERDNYIFLNENCDDDERLKLVKAIIANFKFKEDGTLQGTMLAQNTNFEIGRLKELAELFPTYREKLLAICEKSADLLHLLKTKKGMYSVREDVINYYHKALSGSYSIKKTLPVLVPTLSYNGMRVGNGVQAYITYLNYDSPVPTFGVMKTKNERRDSLSEYCQQDTWAMVEILRAVRKKLSI